MTDKNQNLVVRVVTALVLVPLVLWLIFVGGFWFALLLSVAAGLCALELNLLPFQASVPHPARPADDESIARGQRKKLAKAAREELAELESEGALASGAALVSVGGALLFPLLHSRDARIPFLTPEILLVGVTMIAFADALFFEQRLTHAPRRVAMAVLGVVYPGLFISALIGLRELDRGEWWVILALVCTWLNDTGAYFAGRSFGRTKLYARISPGKTWEGAIGGGLAAIAGALVLRHFWLADDLPAWGAAAIGLGTAFLGPVGDLAESMLKRASGAKDSGRLLPGHGGMLDRIDALLFNAPFVLLCARLFTATR